MQAQHEHQTARSHGSLMVVKWDKGSAWISGCPFSPFEKGGINELHVTNNCRGFKKLVKIFIDYQSIVKACFKILIRFVLLTRNEPYLCAPFKTISPRVGGGMQKRTNEQITFHDKTC